MTDRRLHPIWLRREGDKAVVLVEVNGRWFRVIEEPLHAIVSHMWEGDLDSPRVRPDELTGTPGAS